MLSNIVGEMPTVGVSDHLESWLNVPFTNLLVVKVTYL
jgi:hypothetical protein